MGSKRLQIFLRLYWIRILVITTLVLLTISLIFVIIASINSYVKMESFYKEQMKASMGVQFYLYVVGGLITAVVYVYLFTTMMYRGGGMRGFSKMQTRAIKGRDIGVIWKDVIGMEEAKREAWEVVELIRERARLQKMSGQIIKGVLFVGAPGVGKTYLAKAIATECDMPFLSVLGSEIEGIFVGVGAQKIRKLFKTARDLAELNGGCIIFIDEVDSVARPRRAGVGLGGAESYNMAVNQLLAEMDGLRQKEYNIVTIAATNVNEDELDPALMRAGRFDRKIYIGPPSLEDRENLFSFYLNKMQYDRQSVRVDRLARLTVGNTPADIANIVKESSLIAARRKKFVISMADLEEAREKVALGIRMNIKMSEKDKKIAAYHEAGHVIITYLLVPTQDVFKATIIPRKTTGGVTWTGEREKSYIPDKDDLLGEIKILLGGYCSEKVKFGITSSGVSNDLKRANELAEKMVTLWGMGTSGATSVSDSPFSPHGVAEKDKDDLITNCLNDANEILRKELPTLEKIATELLAKEELDYDAIEAIFKSFGKTRLMEKQTKKREKEITWDDVIGMEETKEEAKEIVNLIKDRAQLQLVGGRIIKGLLMFGPPGCGKTYLASAMANEAGVPFLSKVGSEFVEMYVGVGASRIRHLFQEAKELALSKGGCIIFIDEIDALGGKRSDAQSGGDREYNQTLNQLLAEMDNFKEKEEQYNIVIVGATNQKEDFLDPALLRPGRFDRKIHVDLPTFEDRKKLFAYYLNKVKYNPEEIDCQKFASITPTWSPADIANLTREAALITVRNKKDAIGLKEMDEARERIELGLKRKLTQSKEVLENTAYHEAGHCVAEYYLGKKSFPFKISIIPRTRTLGIAWYGFEGDVPGGTKEEYLGQIRVFLAGYAAERLKFKTSTSGVNSDFKYALKIAHFMVWQVGMGKSGFLGNVMEGLYFHNRQDEPLLSEQMKAQLDIEVQTILKDCLKDTEELLNRERELLDRIAHELLEKEELAYPELEEIFKKYAKNKSTESPDNDKQV
ncbi:MAG: AAA family ATPase [Candidatus Omnitrophota bacterium]|nr:AAA family ATPase [Candidatus Omnitrophota bacterium]